MPSEILKRQFDFWCSLIGLVILSPFFLILAILIKIHSPGPVFFRQERLGKDGKIFKIWKFRSMPVGSDRLNIPVEKIREFERTGSDPRVDKFNHFLRKFAIDELPQLINVLWGEMSFVGPRPFFLARIENNDFLRKRTSIKPGMTSSSAIRGTKLSDEEIMEIDLKYIKERNFMLDIRILLKTIFLALSGRGFYSR